MAQDFRQQEEKELEKELERLINQIKGPDREAERKAELRWSKVAKPLKSLGLLEDYVVQIAGITGSAEIVINKRALVIFCADNGVVEEGVTQTGEEVTAVVASNFTKGGSCACLMAEQVKARVFPVDIGIKYPLKDVGEKYPMIARPIRKGTRNFAKEPAMTRKEALAAILTGVDLVRELKEQGYQIIATGEMGIGNTTTSSAVTAAFLELDPKLVTGKGAGLSADGLERKTEVVKKGLFLHKPKKDDGVDVLAKVGGFDLAGLSGVFLGGAVYGIPIIIDGFISAAAALSAVVIGGEKSGCVRASMLASHCSTEPAGAMLLKHLGKSPVIQAGMCLGEGTGAVALLPLLDMAITVYQNMSTFEEIKIEEYKPL